MELWDVYDCDRNKLQKTVERGDNLKDGEFHLVVNAWIKNNQNEFLITQRAPNKKLPYMWECTGGSVLKGETSLEAAIREIKEETGITVSENTARLLGSTLRFYPNCSDILDVWIFEDNTPIEDVVCQEEEVCNAMWASADKIREMYKEKKFEANAFFESALSSNKDET